MEYNAKLDAALKALEPDMIDTLQRWIRVPSVRADKSAENAPFGAEVRRALDVAMADINRLGMNARDVDGYCCDEECGMKDLEYYEEKVGLPDMGFSPDAEFPLINTEKGITGMEIRAAIADERLVSIASGTRSNVVPGSAVAVVKGDWREAAADAFDCEDEDCGIETELEGDCTKITVTGVPAHASTPDQGKNAAKMLLAVLKELGVGGEPVKLLVEACGEGDYGVNLGIAGQDEVSGKLTINLGLLFLNDGVLSATFDCRYPVFFNAHAIHATVGKRFAPAGFEMIPGRISEPHHVPESSELVKSLMGVYNEITQTDAKPFAIGGGTYARHLKEGVAFGMMFPGEPELAHQANENIDLSNFFKAARIFAYGIVALCA